MISFRTSRPLIVLAAGYSASALEVHALEASDVLLFSKEPFVARPQLSIGETYNDNIFFRENDERGDFVTTISPGLHLQVGRDLGNHIFLEYTFDQLLYVDNDQLNTSQHHVAFGNHFERGRWTLEGAGGVDFLSNLIGGSRRSALLTERNVDHVNYLVDETFSYSISPKTEVYAGGNYSEVDYESGVPLFDANHWSGTMGFGFHPFPRWGLFGEGFYGQSSISPNLRSQAGGPFSEFFGGFLGARGNFTERLTGTFKGGYEVRQFGGDVEGPSSPVFEISLQQRFSEKTSVSLSYSRRTNVSVEFARSSFTGDLVNLQLRQVIGTTGKLEGTLGGLFYRKDFEELDRQDTLFRVQAGLTYNIQVWLRASLQYEHENLDSSGRGIIDYDVNRVTLRLAAGY